MKKIVIYLVTYLFLFGCAGLIVNENDTFSKKTAKVTTRIGLGMLTFGCSELVIEDAKMNRALKLAEQQTRAAYEKLISAIKTPYTSEREIMVFYLEYMDRIREEAKVRDKIKEWNDAMLAVYSISQQSSMQAQQQMLMRNQQQTLNQMLFEIQHLNRQVDRLR